MRVLTVGKYYWPYQRGIETYLKTLSEGLKDRCELLVAVSNTDKKTTDETIEGVHVKRLSPALHLNSTDFTLGLPKLIKDYNPDIVHLNLPNPWAEMAYFLAGCPGRLFISFHSDIIRQKFLLRLYAPFHRYILKKAEKTIVATPNHITYSPFLSKLPKEKLSVIHYGLDPNNYAHPDTDLVSKYKSQYGPFLLSVGQLVYYKGFDVLIDAMAKTSQIKALIVGNGPLKDKLQKQISGLNLQGRITILPHLAQEELLAAYYASQFFVLPSTYRSEAFGLVQLEAFLAKKPVISTNLPSGVPYVNLDGLSGLVVPPGDSQALAEAISRLSSSNDLRNSLGSYAKERALNDFSASAMVEKTWQLFQ